MRLDRVALLLSLLLAAPTAAAQEVAFDAVDRGWYNLQQGHRDNKMVGSFWTVRAGADAPLPCPFA